MTGRRLFGWMIALALLAASPFAVLHAEAQDSTDPKSMEIATQLLDLAGAKTMIVQMLDQVSPGLTQLVVQANPGKEAEVEEVMNKFIMPKMKASLPEALSKIATVYANHFTPDELAQLVAFYQSPVGHKLVQEQPAMGQEFARLGAAWAQAAAQQAIHDYADEFRKRGLQTPI